MDVETYERTVVKKYCTLNGTEIVTATAIDFLREVEDTEAMFPLRWQSKYDTVAEALVEAEIVGRTNAGSWYAKDRDAIEELLEELRAQYE